MRPPCDHQCHYKNPSAAGVSCSASSLYRRNRLAHVAVAVERGVFEPTVSASVLIDADNHWGFNRKSFSATASESSRSTA